MITAMIMDMTTAIGTIITTMITATAMATFMTSIAAIRTDRRRINSPAPAAGSAAWARSSL